MPTGGKKITVTYKSGAVVVYHVVAADITGIVDHESYIKFHGKKESETTAKDFEVTRPTDGEIAIEDE